MHHFAGDRNHFHKNRSVRNEINLVNHHVNTKISHSVEKTELVIFKSPRKVLFDEIKIELTGKRLYPSNSVKYLGVWINLTLV